jgi:outer membrane autotransporter protein
VQIGGQVELGEGWLIGGSLGYEESRLSTADRTARGTGEAGFGAVTLKYQTGPWLFSGAAFGGYGAYDNSRTISLPGFGAVARSSPETSHAGLLLRGTYTIGAESFYARPSLTLSGVHARTGAYQETGAGALNLDVSSASSNVATLTPAVEIGGRVNLEDGMALRLFVNAGVGFASTDSWSQDSRLAIAPPGTGSFTTRVGMDPVVGRVSVGAQLFASEAYEFRLQYDGEFGSTLTGHGGSLAVALRF